MAQASGSSKLARWLAVAAVWAAVAGLCLGAWFLMVEPGRRLARNYARASGEYQEIAAQARARGLDARPADDFADVDELRTAARALRRRLTGSATPRLAAGAPTEVRLALDSFSGYAILRDPAFAADLAAGGVTLTLVDDNADYAARLKSVADESTPVAAFTLDALLKASADAGGLPATVVMVLDESVGADAMVAPAASVPDLDALDVADARIVLTPDSPSEALARVVLDTFAGGTLSAEANFLPAEGAADVLDRLRDDLDQNAGGPRAYVLWEPHLARALELPGVAVLLDSSRFRGFIVDVLVVNRDWLLANEPAVAELVRAYRRAAHDARRRGLAELVAADARRLGEPVIDAQAQRIAEGVWWKTTRENYAHFGLEPAGDLLTLDRMIRQLVRVLTRTGGLASDPTGGDPAALYYDGVLRQLRDEGFHPGVAVADEPGRTAPPPEPLSDDQWRQLEPVGTLQTRPLVFARGRSALTRQSELALDELAATLESFPQFYVRVIGGALAAGDAEANRRLAQARAQAAAEYLTQAGVAPARVRALGTEPTDATNRTVRFEVGQLPY